MSAAKRLLSFLNPWRYSGGYKALTDIADDGSTARNTIIPYTSRNVMAG